MTEVQSGSRAHYQGIQSGDELVSAQGVSLAHLPAEDVPEFVLAVSRRGDKDEDADDEDDDGAPVMMMMMMMVMGVRMVSLTSSSAGILLQA